jgi:hypothetical protein
LGKPVEYKILAQVSLRDQSGIDKQIGGGLIMLRRRIMLMKNFWHIFAGFNVMLFTSVIVVFTILNQRERDQRAGNLAPQAQLHRWKARAHGWQFAASSVILQSHMASAAFERGRQVESTPSVIVRIVAGLDFM